ncbi:MAG: hypothetical protein ACI9WU_004390 [Myxococcota bacterium]|jgi:hypothetical protein
MPVVYNLPLMRSRYMLYAALLASLVSCGDAATGRTGSADVGDPGDAEALFDPETGEPIEDVQEVLADLEIIVLHDTSIPINVLIQDELTLRAKVVNYAEGKPAEEVEVAFDIVDNEGFGGSSGDASLSSKVAFTNAEGEVENTFRANFVGDVNYTVKLSAEGAEDKFVDIIVSDTPTGSIEVLLAYQGPININTIKVRLMPKSFICGQFIPTGSLAGSLADKTVLSLADKPVFDGLAGGSHFTMVATAKSPSGALAAAGCRDGVFVIANAKTPTSLELHLLPLNPTGNYDVDNYFDFTQALGELGTVGEVIQGVVTLFNDPGKFILDQIKTLVKQFIGEIITDIAFGLFEDALGDVITDWVLNDSPQWVQDFFTIGDDLTQIVDNLHLRSVLKISKLHNDYYFQGIQFWNGIVLSWKYGCEPEDPPDCGDLVFSMDDFGNTQFPQDIIEGKFTGTIVNYNQLFLDQHTIQISYGKLILFVLNEVILKTITGENNLKDAVLKFVNCSSIAAAIENGVLDAIGLPESKLDSFCVSTITLLLVPLEAFIGNLALDSQLRLSGQCTLLEETDDLIVDELFEGTYSGMVEIEAGAGPPFSGTFSGVRQSMVPAP